MAAPSVRQLPPESHAATLAHVAAALDRVRFGAIQLTLHEGRVVQIDVTERQRLP